MPDWHYHANHIDAPARGSKAAAMKDARRLHVAYASVHVPHDSDTWVVNDVVSAETLRAHGAEFPMIVRCYRTDCNIKKGA